MGLIHQWRKGYKTFVFYVIFVAKNRSHLLPLLYEPVAKPLLIVHVEHVKHQNTLHVLPVLHG